MKLAIETGEDVILWFITFPNLYNLLFNLLFNEGISADTKRLIKDKLSVSDAKIYKVLRFGKHRENAPRSIVVVVTDERTK